MCGRFALASNITEIAESIDCQPLPELTPFEPSWNVAPSRWAPVISETGIDSEPVVRHMRLMRWGLRPGWSKQSHQEPANARSETVDQKPMFRNAWKKRRCVIPADGWYEWMTTVSGKTPWYHYRMDGQICFLAGIWETWTGDNGDHIESFALLTSDANDDVSDVHNRMPLLLDHSELPDWFSGKDIRRVTPLGWVDRHAVSREVNNASNDGPHLIEAIPTLF